MIERKSWSSAALGGSMLRCKMRLALVAFVALGTLLAPGTMHLGRATGVDMRYMDVGAYCIGPQFLVHSPRKVWRGRSRGNNEPPTLWAMASQATP
jgi:hypothetical protein